MKIILQMFLFLLVFNSNLFGKTYALIIGISQYKDKNIKDLNYADADALAFRNFLLSESGGSVDSNNIVLLLNDQAKVGDIYAAKRMLELKVKKNDLVYFYFSGHGGVESDIYKSGFLLAYDTPINNFQNNSIEILHINKMANTFSAQTKANVVLITDACRSGSLAGIDDIGKKLLMQDQLIEANKREVRMASCLHNQLSLENKVWGGGRGLFSYELLKGLQGNADENKDLKVTLKELQNYLNSTMEEEIDKFLFDPQTPLFDGEEKTILAKIDTNFKSIDTFVNRSFNKLDGDTKSAVSIAISTNDQFFNLLEENFFDGTKSYLEYTDAPINSFIDSIFSKKLFLSGNESNATIIIEKFAKIEAEINSDLEAHFAFKQKLAAAIHNVIQKVINSYISVDKEELERRQFYNSNAKVFKNYAYMIDLALNAVSSNSELYQILQMKKWYFQGVGKRFEFNKSLNADSLIDEAIVFQEKAEKINANVAYIQNELGILYECRFDSVRAEQKYLKAIELVPEWALPYSNLSNLYYTLGKYELGIKMAEKALKLHPDLNLANFGLGKNSSMKGNYLLAKESYLKAIRSNPLHYIAYQYLGELYLQLAEYKLADEYLRKAEELKKSPLTFGLSSLDKEAFSPPSTVSASVSVSMTIIEIQGEDILSLFYDGTQNDNISSLKKILKLDDKNFLSYKVLGYKYYAKQQYMEAERMFLLAKKYHIAKDSFLLEASKLLNSKIENVNELFSFYERSYFTIDEINELLADLYSKWGYSEKAIVLYKQIQSENPHKFIIYHKLWTLYEKLNNYHEAEKVIEAYRAIEIEQGNKELYAFYKRAIIHSGDSEYYNLAAGLMMINLHQEKISDPYYFDLKLENVEGTAYVPKDFDEIYSEEYMIAPEYGNPLELAIEHLELINTIHLYYDNYQIAAKLGWLYGCKGDTDKSEEYFSIALNNPMTKIYANVYLSSLNRSQYNFYRAYSNLKTLRESSSLDYEKSIEFVEYAVLAGDYKEADSTIIRINTLDINPNKDILKLEALLNLLSGKHEAAIKLYEKLLDNDPKNPILAFTIFRIYAQNQNPVEADPYLGIALNNGIMQYASLMRYDSYAYKGMFRFANKISNNYDLNSQ